jgi:hypothetical protein
LSGTPSVVNTAMLVSSILANTIYKKSVKKNGRTRRPLSL